MKYFLHDTSALDDEKVTMLYMEFGYEAVGLFYCILEKLGKQEKPVPEIVLKSQLNIKKKLQKQLDFMYKIGILSVKNTEVFSETLLNFSEKYQIKKENTRKRVSEWRNKQKDTKDVTRYEHVSNASKVKESKVKESKVKESKEEKEKIDYEDIKGFFNSLCIGLSKVQKITESRKSSIKARIKDYDIVTIKNVFESVSESKFLNGNNDRNWKADFDWILKPNNFIKILEGNYKNKSNGLTTHNISPPVQGVKLKP